MNLSPRSKRVDLVLCAFLGIFGAHRFYEGKIVTGVLYALSLGGLGIGAIADLLQIALGVRTDKRGLTIGTKSKLPTRLTKVLTVVVAVAVVVALVGVWFDRALNGPVVADDYYEHVETGAPIEAEYAAWGQDEVDEVEFDSGDSKFGRFKVWFPADIGEQPHIPRPAVVIANGSGTPFFRFEPVFRHLASWGFIVIGNDDPDSGDGRSASLSLSFLNALNDTPESEFYQLIDTDRIGIAGHSQGGAAAINAATRYPNSDGISSVFVASTPSRSLIEEAELTGWDYDLTLLQVPFFSVAGTGKADAEVISPLGSMRENFAALPEGLPAVMGRRDGANHGDMLTWADGYMTAWFQATLKADGRASSAFVGPDAEIEGNDLWRDVARKNLDGPLIATGRLPD